MNKSTETAIAEDDDSTVIQDLLCCTMQCENCEIVDICKQSLKEVKIFEGEI